jgi:hypothetical protein
MGKIVQRQLGPIEKRVEARDKVPFSASDDVFKLVIGRCTETESGGRMIDVILTKGQADRAGGVGCQRRQLQLRLRRGGLKPVGQKGENHGYYLQSNSGAAGLEEGQQRGAGLAGERPGAEAHR